MKAFFSSTDPQHIRCSTSVLGQFTKQMAVLLAAGVPLHEALSSMTKVQSDKLSLWVTPEIYQHITNGHRFSSAIHKFPKVFPKTYVALVRGSEETGQMADVLDQLGDWLERQDSIERQVKKSLTYPVFVIVLASILTFILFKTVVPGILDTVIALGAELPMPTKILLGIIAALESPIFWLFVISMLVLTIWYLRTPDGWHRFIVFCHFMPVIGGILRASGSARYSHTLAMLLASGVDVLRSTKIAADSSGNPLLRQDSERVAKELREGNYLSDTLAQRPFYPTLLVDMVKVGDESGQSSHLVKRCADLLEEETVHRLEMFTNLLEPIVLGAVSLVVGSVIVAIMLPMSNMIANL